eukprot:13496814-Heterocapsa_arctica.AAC.1
MKRRGSGPGFIKVFEALNEGSKYRVRVRGGISRDYFPDKGLREGCPSSPPLFNVYHYAVMGDFRERRQEEATLNGEMPGLEWRVKVDGRL